MNTSDHSNDDRYKKSLERWREGVTDAVFSAPEISPPRKWLYAVLVIYGLATSALGVGHAHWYAHAFLLVPFLWCIIPLTRSRFENKKRRTKNPAQPRLDAPGQRNDRGSPGAQ